MKTLLFLLLACGLPVAAQELAQEYVIGPKDVIAVTVYGEADLSGKFTVESDGTIAFPLLGRVKAAGSTGRGLEEELTRLLKGGILKNPRVAVTLEAYQSQRIFVVGEVRSPGMFPLTATMTVLEAIARAGDTTPKAADEVLIVRPRTAAAKGPSLPGEDKNAEVIRVDLAQVQAGALGLNAALRDGDTLVVPEAQSVWVYGQVRSPGAFRAERGMTVLQALTLAGGLTDRGSTRGLRIIRVPDGTKKEINAKLSDPVQPGDTIVVKERLF